jgi:chemotaxis protein histidine kinase CheA
MASKTDIVSLKWVIGLMNKQAENAEAALVEYSKDTRQKQPLLQCMWAVHQITSTLRALGIRKGEMLSIEMERTLNFLYKDKVLGERRKLAMGGLMQALKVLPAYLAHVQSAREDTGRGLEQHVNDLRRWVGERPRPQAF